MRYGVAILAAITKQRAKGGVAWKFKLGHVHDFANGFVGHKDASMGPHG